MATPRERPTDSEQHSSGLVWFREAFFDQGMPDDPDGADRLAQSMVKQRLLGDSDTTQVGRFVVLDKLGEGGMGVVYSAYDKELDRKVAVKLLRRTDAGEDGHRRMQREAQAMARLSHPNVVQVYEVGFYEGQLFVVMEFVEGQTLRTWCRAKQWRWQEVVRVFSEAGRGLAAAHAAGLVHRDFKPENVLIGDDGRVRVLDFGLARAHELEDESEPETRPLALSAVHTSAPTSSSASASSSALADRLTLSGTVLGTPAYMSPEQHMRQPADARSDQFSFCVALYEGLAGERPFDEDNRAVLAFAKQTGQVREWPRERTKVPKWLRRAIARGLLPHPVERWPSMTALLAELDRARSRLRRRSFVAIAVIIAVVAAAGYGAVSSWAAASEICMGSEVERSRMWSPIRQGRVRMAMLQADPEVAQEAWPKVSSGVQTYAEQWAAVHLEACEATHVHREQSRHLYNLQLQCLDRRRGQLDALLDVLAEAETKMVAQATEAVATLAPVSDCADQKRLQASSARLLPPEDPEVLAVVDELQDALVWVETLGNFGRKDEARRELEQVLVKAREAGYRPLLAEAEYKRGELEMKLGEDMVAAERALIEALWTAEEVRHDRISALAMASYLRLVGIEQGRRDQAMRHVRHAEAILRRSDLAEGAHKELLASLSNLLYVDETTADADSVQEEFERAYSWEKVRSSDQLSLTSSLRSLGEELEREGELEKAVEHYTRALEVARGQAGEGSPDVAELLSHLGGVYYELGQSRLAAKTYMQAQQIYRDKLDEHDPRRIRVAFRLAEVAMIRGEFRRAATYLVRTRRNVPEGLLSAEERILQGELHRRRGKLKKAQQFYEAGLQQLPEPAEDAGADGDEDLATTWLYVRAQTGLGEVNSLRGSHTRGVEALKRALVIGEKHEDDAPRGWMARVHFSLARALWAKAGNDGDDESRFVALGNARAALRDYRDLRGRYLVEQAEVEAWLQARAE